MFIASSYNNVINDSRPLHGGESSTRSLIYAKMLKQTPAILQSTPDSATFLLDGVYTC